MYNRTLTAMMRYYVNDHQQDWDVYNSILAIVCKSHVNRSTNSLPFDPVLNQQVQDFTVPSKVSHGKMLTAAVKRPEFLTKLQKSLDRARAFLQRTQERY